MKFKIISHACMLVELNGKKLLVDPWVVGSAYWRSWWHFPESVPLDDEMLSVDYIYLTHEHFDHFHYPSMRKFDKKTKVLVAEFPISSMEEALHSLGFENVTSMKHGVTYELDPGVRLTSYQTSWIADSALVIDDGETKLLDLNDTKFESSVMKKIVSKHAPFDFMFRSHSSAQAYPECYESDDVADLQLRNTSDYIDDFLSAARVTGCKYAVPFASNVCHLHDESYDKNTDSVNPLNVLESAGEMRDVVKVMLPGSTWSSTEGFDCADTGILERKREILERMRSEVRPKLDEQDEYERGIQLSYESFSSYMGDFLKKLPWLISMVFKVRIAYRNTSSPDPEYWVLDFGTRKVSRLAEEPEDVASIITVSPGLLQDAMDKSIVNFVDISKRLHVKIKNRKVIHHFIFKELITMYEMGYFPLYKNVFSRRFIGSWFRRRSEVFSYFRKLFRGLDTFVPKVDAD